MKSCVRRCGKATGTALRQEHRRVTMRQALLRLPPCLARNKRALRCGQPTGRAAAAGIRATVVQHGAV